MRERPWGDRCACRVTNRRNTHDPRSCGHAYTTFEQIGEENQIRKLGPRRN